jgi:hypothetical protein
VKQYLFTNSESLDFHVAITDRPYIIRRFLQKWHNVCVESTMEEADMPQQDSSTTDVAPKQKWAKAKPA